MKNKRSFLILALLFVVLIAGAAVLYNSFGKGVKPDTLASVPADDGEESENNSDKTGSNPAPDFTVYDAEGKTVKLSDMKGKPTIVNFWASWCGPCKMEMPDFEEMYKKYGSEINFMMVNLTDGASETVSSAKKYIDSQGYTFPVYYDKDSIAAYTYSVYSIPMTLFIDAEGNFVVYAQGAIDADTLQKGIDMIYTAQ